VEKRTLNWITGGLVVLTVLAVAVILTNTLQRSQHITLPDTDVSTEQTAATTGGDALTVISVTPQTVQAAVETLTRPEAYRRTVTVEQFWSGGSGSYETTVTVSGGWTRTDRTMADGRIRHTITGPETAYVWYNQERTVYSAPTGTISADNEQSIPTYEDILALPVERITEADYRSVSDVDCIYVEAEDGAYTLRYWVSVDTGLLVVAEKLLDGETVYRMGALTADLSEPASSEFTLPDGTSLLT
jgi:hypothetical protein